MKENPMIGVYAGVSVKPEHVEEFLVSTPALVEASRKDAGNISYDFGPAAGETPAGEPRVFAFIERWESQQALEAHMATEHFGTAVKTWEPLLAAELDVRIFEM